MTYDHKEVESRWQTAWTESGLDISERVDGKKKFMIIFAYPGVTGFLHVGHLRGYTYADAIARYKRMKGYNVLFPTGTHATGNGAISLANKVASNDEEFIDYLLRNGCPKDRLEDLKDVKGVVEFFNSAYINDYWRRFGLLSDWRRFTCTLNPDYSKFIQWQFRKLDQLGLLIQKPYFAPACPVDGPVAVDASETDISKGGNAEVQEYTLLKFKHDDEYLIAATLRPETVYGQVCFWVNPKVEYVRLRKGGEAWIVSPQAFDKLTKQVDGIEMVGTIPGREMIGWMCEAPMIHRSIPVFPASFCDPNVGTGLVTSVPSDAPDDWISLEEVKRNKDLQDRYGIPQGIIESTVPISIISIKGYGDFPARDVIERMGITQPGDPRLVDAKKEVYKDGYHMGVMKPICGQFANMRVDDAKEAMKRAMLDSGEAEVFHDLTEEVICRCGKRVHVKRIDDQWFIDYAGEDLTRRTSDHCRDMRIFPPEFQENVHGTLSWFRERSCVRQGNWLGTEFPFDPKWIIEAISDSTLYPLYYIISMYANEGRISPESMTEEFFDLVVLKRGDVDSVSKSTGIGKDLLIQIQMDVEYWYPLDVNLGGKEHMTVHFPVFLFNHRAILPDSMQPREILVNWYITGDKNKISKSKGGAQPIPNAVDEFGADAMRLYYAHIASMFVDVEWKEEAVLNYRFRLERIHGAVEGLISKMDGSRSYIDGWLLARVSTHLRGIEDAMGRHDLRQLSTIAYYDMPNDLKWYTRRGGKGGCEEFLRAWIMAMTPITPHLAEELWSMAGFEGLASVQEFPSPTDDDGDFEAVEDFIRNVMSDVSSIRKIANGGSKVMIYTTPRWRTDVLKMALEMHDGGTLSIPDLTKRCMSDDGLRSKGKMVPEYVKKVVIDIQRTDIGAIRSSASMDELAVLSMAREFLSMEMEASVDVTSADDEGIYDPQGKSKMAMPGRPAIYLE